MTVQEMLDLIRDGQTDHLDSWELAGFVRTANEIRRLPVVESNGAAGSGRRSA